MRVRQSIMKDFWLSFGFINFLIINLFMFVCLSVYVYISVYVHSLCVYIFGLLHLRY